MRPTTNVAANFLRVLLFVVAKDLQQLFCSRDPILELAKVHAGKANAWLPSKQDLIGGVSVIGWSEKHKTLKSKNGQADYLPRHSPDVRTVFEI